MTDKLFIYTDGGARGNPGPAAVGIYIVDQNGKELFKLGKKIGTVTNNVAEYTAVIEALCWLKENKDDLLLNNYSINFFLDSKLVVCQLNGLYKIKDNKLKELSIKVRELEQAIGGNVRYSFIPREKNTVADALVNSSYLDL